MDADDNPSEGEYNRKIASKQLKHRYEIWRKAAKIYKANQGLCYSKMRFDELTSRIDNTRQIYIGIGIQHHFE